MAEEEAVVLKIKTKILRTDALIMLSQEKTVKLETQEEEVIEDQTDAQTNVAQENQPAAEEEPEEAEEPSKTLEL